MKVLEKVEGEEEGDPSFLTMTSGCTGTLVRESTELASATKETIRDARST